jgi:hypothetical protein
MDDEVLSVNSRPAPDAAAQWVLRIDGAFLLVAGLGGLTADLLGYFFGTGPFAALADQPLALGVVEAHGLAAVIGVLLVKAAPAERKRWHAVGGAVHLFLGLANLLFWDVYAFMGVTHAGVVSTAAHAVLFGVQAACLLQTSRSVAGLSRA